MPALRRMLPRPCPCGKESGTVQLIIFNHKYISSRHTVTCRIKHYYPEFHRLTREKRQQQERDERIRRAAITGKKKVSHKARWCSFQTRHRIDFVDKTGRKVPLGEYFDIYKEDYSKSKTFSLDESFYNLVKERGWGIKEDARWRDRYWAEFMKRHGYDALPKNIFSHEEAIPESERLKYSKHRRWGLLPDIVAAKKALKLFEE